MAVAERLEAEARELGKETRETQEWRLGHVRDSLATLTVALRNAAHTGPQSHEDGLHSFFPDEYPGEPARERDPWLDYRAQLDVLAFLTVGDMVMYDVAALVLGRERRELPRDVWPAYMSLVDRELAAHEPQSPEVAPARVLDLTLREARHRLVAHRLVTQSALFTWDRDHIPTPVMVNPAGLPDAYGLLRDANARLLVPMHAPAGYTYGGWADLVDWIIRRAGDLDGQGRDLVRRAFRLGEYELPPVADLAESVLELVTAAVTHPIAPEADAAENPGAAERA